MPSLKDHCEHCQYKLGQPFSEVHIWLDDLYQRFKGINHRDVRHNMRGIEEVRRMWGDEAAKAAILHIRLDWGNIPEDQIPRDRAQAAIFRKAILARYSKTK